MAKTKTTATKQEFIPAPSNLKIDDKVVKKTAGDVIMATPGVLGVKGGIVDIMKDQDDVTKGITVHITEENNVEMSVKLIAESGKNLPEMVNEITGKIEQALKNNLGLTARDICIEVADTMTAEEYKTANSAAGVNASAFPVYQ